ncbi:hypothetical protein JCM8547_008550 [Rhodosporidiobolus lusitaniae]
MSDDPSAHSHSNHSRNIDGTSNEVGALEQVTNVAKLFSLFMDDPFEQLIYYQMFIFGFSRGAYSARALAGMLDLVGLLPCVNEESLLPAFDTYKSWDEKRGARFKLHLSKEVRVHFVGVWDTVSSIGADVPQFFPLARGSSHVKQFRHALSLDERRTRFSSELWLLEDQYRVAGRDLEEEAFSAAPNVKEVFFPGSHSDVGAVEQGLRVDSSRVAGSPLFSPYLAKARLAVDEPTDPRLKEFLHNALHSGPAMNDYIATAVYLAARQSLIGEKDALAPTADHLSPSYHFESFKAQPKASSALVFLWWSLESVPAAGWKWDPVKGKVQLNIKPHLGRGRLLPPSPAMHWSDQVRFSGQLNESTQLCPPFNPAFASFDFSLPFTLVSAVGHSFSVDPLKLAGTSEVFADMLSSGTGGRKVVLTESKEEIERYLACIEKGVAPVEETTWFSVCKMADKYQSELARGVLLLSWQQVPFSSLLTLVPFYPNPNLVAIGSIWLPNSLKSCYATAILGGRNEFDANLASCAVEQETESFLYNQLAELDRLRFW